MLSQELEFCLNDAFRQGARGPPRIPDGRAPAARRSSTRRRCARSCGPAARTWPGSRTLKEHHRPDHAAAAERRRPRSAADARLPARPAARGVPRAVERQEGSRRRQRAGRDLQREAVPRGVPAESCRTSRGSTSSTSSRTACRRSPRRRPRKEEARRRRRPSATAKAAARSRSTPPTSTSWRRTARSIR